MTWQPAYGGAVLALRDHTRRIVATIDGPHPAGYVFRIYAQLHRGRSAARVMQLEHRLGLDPNRPASAGDAGE